MRNDTDTSLRATRRRFLQSAVVAGTAAVAGSVIATGVASDGEPGPAARGQDSAKGYQETEHVRNYYRSARI
jgi:hypothetical protein